MAFITRLLKSSKTLTVPLLLAMPLDAADGGINATRAEAKLAHAGQFSINSRFHTDLPDQLKEVLKQGVPLHLNLNWRLPAPSVASYKLKFDQLLNNDSTIQYKLSFHPLTNRYRVTVGTFSTGCDTLEAASRAMDAIANWKVLSKGALSEVAAKGTKAEIRLLLATAKLPKPFQINTLTSKNRHLDPGWKSLSVVQE